MLVAGSDDGTVWMWNALKGQFMQVFAGHTGPVTAGRFSPDGRLLVSVSEDTSLRVWNPKTGAAVHTVHEPRFHTEPVVALAMHGSRELCATGGIDGKVCIVQYIAGRLLQTLTGHTDSVECVEWAVSGARKVPPYANTWLASGSVDGDARVWNSETGQLVQTLSGHEGAVVRLGFTCSAANASVLLLLTASTDRTVRMWDARSSQAVRVMHGHRAPILSATLTLSQVFVTCGDDKQALCWLPHEQQDKAAEAN